MNKRLTYIDPLQCGKVLAVLYGLLSLVFVPFILLITLMGASASGRSGLGGLFLLILAPIMYAVIGFVGGLIAAVIYNLVAKWTGGLLFTLTDDTPQLPQTQAPIRY